VERKTHYPTWKALAAKQHVPPLALDARPHFRRGVELEREDERVSQITAEGAAVPFEDGDGTDIASVARTADGTRTIAEIAAASGLATERAQAVLSRLYELGVVDVGDAELVAPLAFHRHIEQLGLRVDRRVRRESGLLPRLSEGPGRRLVLGYLVDKFHFVDSAASHLGAAVHHAPTDRTRMMLTEYLADEYWHGKWLRSGLRAAGLSDDEIERSAPLPATVGLINLLRWTAATDVLSYAACLAVWEHGGPERAAGLRSMWDRLLEHKLLPREALMPFRGHALADSELGHGSLWAEPFVDASPLGGPQRQVITRTVLSLLHAMAESHTAIVRYYGPSDGPAYFTLD
jgi:hypothetical protein